MLFPTYSKYTESSEQILSFYLHVLGSLQQQMGAEATKHTIQVFLDVAMRYYGFIYDEFNFFKEIFLAINKQNRCQDWTSY